MPKLVHGRATIARTADKDESLVGFFLGAIRGEIRLGNTNIRLLFFVDE
tara:strand:- start:517 stop:663 length:147 start_codon:yes stop_codon:yes gene_type:complete